MLQFHIGSGDTIWLWTDPWDTLGPLGLVFPRGPALTGLPRDSKLSTVIDGLSWQWPSTSSPILQLIQDVLPPILGGPDSITWCSTNNRFSTSSAYQIFMPESTKVPWYSLFHRPLKIPRNQFIMWLASLDKLSNRDKTWLNLPSQTCCLCNMDVLETCSHLFFECDISWQCLTLLQTRTKFSWPRTQWRQGLLWASARLRGRHLINAAYCAALASLVYHIWKERNCRRFTGLTTTQNQSLQMWRNIFDFEFLVKI
ncbi:UNVERIFIED_CONTAM: hypothetical protein Slati_2689900 [Sesamum latifolium]|uniref:Reverse transcriptase zinc-binding domain-containing protein n=1 Tax=Sesamum latifolium TaxID=2727402 RepID=A0AAW2W075_9LAMI